jgi:subtilisin family serine protease
MPVWVRLAATSSVAAPAGLAEGCVVCEFVPGEVIVSFPSDAGEHMREWFEDHGAEEDVKLLDTLDERLERLRIPEMARVRDGYERWRIGVPPGHEYFKMNELRLHYQMAVAQYSQLFGDRLLEVLLNFTATPNALGHASAGPLQEGGPVVLNDTHRAYRELLQIPDELEDVQNSEAGIVVAVLDSGADASLGPYVMRRRDFVAGGGQESDAAEDAYGHGTAVASIIVDIAPRAQLVVYRVLDEGGRASEWDLVAALMGIADAQLVNLSLQFRHHRKDWSCPTCGRHAGASRSIVLETTLAALLERSSALVLAAAGNDNAEELAYPSRFGNTVAVGAVNSELERSSFSNYGARDHELKAHPSLFFAPGGEKHGMVEEVAASTGRDARYWGTSFACAYATGVAALHRTRSPSLDAQALLTLLRDTAVQDIVGFDSGRHGNGRIRFAVSPDQAAAEILV